MMRNKTFIALFTALIAVLLVVTGCSNLAGPGGSADGGKITLSVDGVNARTIMPSFTYAYEVYKYADALAYYDEIAALEDPDDADDITPPTPVDTGTAPGETKSLAEGNYVLRVIAQVGDVDYAEALVGEYVPATADDPSKIDGYVTVVADAKTAVTVTFTADSIIVKQEGKGTFSWDLSAFSTATSATIDIYAQDTDGSFKATVITDGDLELVVDGDVDHTAKKYKFADSIGLDSGLYLVTFKVDGTNINAGEWDEVLWVYDGITSAYTPSQAITDITDPASLGSLVANIIDKIADGKFTEIVYTQYAVLGIKVGTDEAYYDDDISAAIAAIQADPSYIAPIDKGGLAELIDLALVRAGIDAIISDDDFDGTDTTAIEALVLNETTITVNTDDFTSDGKVVVSAGVIEFTAVKDTPLVIDRQWLTIDTTALVDGQSDNPFGEKPDYEDGVITFAAQNQGAAFALTSDQVAKVLAAGSLIVNITATADPADAVFRGCLGSVVRGNNAWNHTEMYLNGASFSTISGKNIPIAITNRDSFVVDSDPKEPDACIHFIIQKRNDAISTDLTVSSIKIKVVGTYVEP